VRADEIKHSYFLLPYFCFITKLHLSSQLALVKDKNFAWLAITDLLQMHSWSALATMQQERKLKNKTSGMAHEWLQRQLKCYQFSIKLFTFFLTFWSKCKPTLSQQKEKCGYARWVVTFNCKNMLNKTGWLFRNQTLTEKKSFSHFSIVLIIILFSCQC